MPDDRDTLIAAMLRSISIDMTNGPMLIATPCPRACGPLLAAVLTALAMPAQALDDQWYVGAGGSVASLRPDAEAPGFDADDDLVYSGTILIGRDLDDRSSVQLQLLGLGEASFESGETVDYAAGDASVLYRFIDSRDRAPQGQLFGASLYGRFGLGFMKRDSDIDLENDGSVYFGAGAGVEIYATNNLSLRVEGIYHEVDAASANVSLVARFGGRSGRLPPIPDMTGDRAAKPEATTATGVDQIAADRNSASNTSIERMPNDAPTDTASTPDPRRAADEASGANLGSAPDDVMAAAPATSPGAGETRNDVVDALPPTGAADADNDGIPDERDACALSAPGFPVLENGCALLDGVLSGLQFAPGTADFLPGTVEQLDYLASLLSDFPQARIELLAHTDNSGTVRDQSIITRSRLRALGTYLTLQKGISANRLLLRSFGGTRPLVDNGSEQGRLRNNRIEVLENAN